MTVYGTFVRRHFEPLVLSTQVFVDLLVVLVSCWLAYVVGNELGWNNPRTAFDVYRELWALIAAICLVTFHSTGMYSPTKSLLNIEEFKAIAKSTVIAFLVLFTLIIFLRRSDQPGAEGSFYSWIYAIHRWIDLDLNPNSFSRFTVLLTFVLILVLSTLSRFASFKAIQMLHRRGIGNRNVLIYGAGPTGQRLQRKFMLVPTLGLNLAGFLDDDESRVGASVERSQVLGSLADLEYVVGTRKVSEVFVALPEVSEERVLEIIGELERLGVEYHVVPRFYHLMSYKVRIENLDSIPLISRPDRRQSLIGMVAKRALDLVGSAAVLLLAAPVFLIAAILIKRESPGPVFFLQRRIGKDGKPFRMIKFRTMHHHMSGDAPTPNSPRDPRITRIGRFLRRYSLDELPQFLNVLLGEMSIVGPRPEMPFIVETYGPLDRERLRAKPGITGLWQISYARQLAIHDNVDYDLYYIEHQSLLLDLIIISLTSVAVIKGTGAY